MPGARAHGRAVVWLGLPGPDRALERANEALALATELEQPYTLAFAIFHASFLLLSCSLSAVLALDLTSG